MRAPPSYNVHTLAMPMIQVVEPSIAHLRQLHEIAVRILHRCGQKEARVLWGVQQRETSVREALRERVNIEHIEGKLDGTDPCSSVREIFDRMNSEVDVAEITAPMGQRTFVLFCLERNPEHNAIELSKPLWRLGDENHSREELDRFAQDYSSRDLSSRAAQMGAQLRTTAPPKDADVPV